MYVYACIGGCVGSWLVSWLAGCKISHINKARLIWDHRVRATLQHVKPALSVNVNIYFSSFIVAILERTSSVEVFICQRA